MPQIQVFRCPSCGASLSYEGGPEITVTCQFCGTNAIVPQELRAAAEPHATPPLVPPDRQAQEEAMRAGREPTAGPATPLQGGASSSADINRAGMATVEQLAQAGQKLEAIKVYRLITGVGLREAKDAVEAMMAGAAPQPPRIAPAQPARRVRRRGGRGCFPSLVLIAGFFFVFNYLPYRLSGSYTKALSLVRSNPQVVKDLGEPVEADWWLLGDSWSCGSTCSQRYTLFIHGSKKSGRFFVNANLRAVVSFFDPAAWTVQGTVTTDRGQEYDVPPGSTTPARRTPAPMATAAPRATIAPRATPTPNRAATAQVMLLEQNPVKPTPWQATPPDTAAKVFDGWPVGTKQDDAIAVTTTVQAKDYLWTVFPKHSSSYMNFTPEYATPVQDFFATVDLEFVAGAAGNTYAYGLVFRLVGDDYGFFGLQNDGKFKLLLVKQTGIYEQVIESSAAILTRPGSSNRLVIRNIGPDFVFEINSQDVWSFHKELDPGAVGLGVDVGVKGQPAHIRFSNFLIRVPSP